MLLRNKPNAQTPTDPRIAELLDLVATEGIILPMPIDMILFFEKQGYVVDLITGEVAKYSDSTPTPSGRAVAHLLGAGMATLPYVHVNDDEIDALLEEVFGKPELGVEDSAGIFDVADDVHPAAMSEGAFMTYITAQLDAGKLQPWVREHFDDADGYGDDYDIGEDESLRPFYY